MLTLFLSSIGFAVPLQVTQQGRILDSNGAGVSGLHGLTFRIYDAETSGTLLWEETITETMTNGYYAAVLGADETNNPLDSTILELYPIYLEFQLDSNSPVATRQAINSAPYAQIAGKAEVATSVNGGSVNATYVQISGNPVIDGTGSWVGPAITVDWNNIDPSTIPSYIADGDDNTQLSKTEVLYYVDGETLNLGASSKVDGSDIVTADSFSTHLPADADTLASLNCATGEIASWDGNSSWVCTSDNTLEWADIESLLNNNPVDLNASTTIGGAEIITTVDDADTLATLSCSDGEIAKYDSGLGDWYCDVDVDTTLTSTEVTTMVEAGSVNLATGSQVNSRNIVGQPSVCSDGQVLVYNSTSNDWDCGDDTDTTLTPTEMQTMIEALSLNLQNVPQVNGENVLLENSTLNPLKLDVSAASEGSYLTVENGVPSWNTSLGASIRVTRISPTDAPLDETTTIDIYGGIFGLDIASITVGEVELSDLIFVDETHVQGTLHGFDLAGVGNYDLTVVESSGLSATLELGYEATTATALTIDSFEIKAFSSSHVGTTWTVRGTGFLEPMNVTIGGVASASVAVVSNTELTFLIPSTSVGTHDITFVRDADSSTYLVSEAYVNTYSCPASYSEAIGQPTGFSNFGNSSCTGTEYVLYHPNYDYWMTNGGDNSVANPYREVHTPLCYKTSGSNAYIEYVLNSDWSCLGTGWGYSSSFGGGGMTAHEVIDAQ